MSTPTRPATAFRMLPVTALALDRDNPRLPEGASAWSESDLVRYFRTEYGIDELIDSMLANGFFAQEPLLVLETPDRKTGRYTVVEGNRRLASLLYIHGAVDEDYFDESPSDKQLARLEEVPCVFVESREAVRTYLGFRHVGGLKDWSPEAKARFIRAEVEERAARGEDRPFFRVAKAYGSNTQGVRNLYVAITLLVHVRDELGLDVRYVQFQRFGVWQRLLNSATVKTYIGFGSPKTYEEIQRALRSLDEPRLREVIADLTPKPGGKVLALLSDSRRITDYGKVLNDPRALKVLREYDDLDAAIQVLREGDLPARIEKIARTLNALVDEVFDAPWSEELEDVVRDVWRSARKLKAGLLAEPEDAGA